MLGAGANQILHFGVTFDDPSAQNVLFAMHSSHNELLELVRLFNPRDVYPCVGNKKVRAGAEIRAKFDHLIDNTMRQDSWGSAGPPREDPVVPVARGPSVSELLQQILDNATKGGNQPNPDAEEAVGGAGENITLDPPPPDPPSALHAGDDDAMTQFDPPLHDALLEDDDDDDKTQIDTSLPPDNSRTASSYSPPSRLLDRAASVESRTTIPCGNEPAGRGGGVSQGLHVFCRSSPACSPPGLRVIDGPLVVDEFLPNGSGDAIEEMVSADRRRETVQDSMDCDPDEVLANAGTALIYPCPLATAWTLPGTKAPPARASESVKRKSPAVRNETGSRDRARTDLGRRDGPFTDVPPIATTRPADTLAKIDVDWCRDSDIATSSAAGERREITDPMQLDHPSARSDPSAVAPLVRQISRHLITSPNINVDRPGERGMDSTVSSAPAKRVKSTDSIQRAPPPALKPRSPPIVVPLVRQKASRQLPSGWFTKRPTPTPALAHRRTQSPPPNPASSPDRASLFIPSSIPHEREEDFADFSPPRARPSYPAGFARSPRWPEELDEIVGSSVDDFSIPDPVGSLALGTAQLQVVGLTVDADSERGDAAAGRAKGRVRPYPEVGERVRQRGRVSLPGKAVAQSDAGAKRSRSLGGSTSQRRLLIPTARVTASLRELSTNDGGRENTLPGGGGSLSSLGSRIMAAVSARGRSGGARAIAAAASSAGTRRTITNLAPPPNRKNPITTTATHHPAAPATHPIRPKPPLPIPLLPRNTLRGGHACWIHLGDRYPVTDTRPRRACSYSGCGFAGWVAACFYVFGWA
ncbi:hypothetical protein BDK51DRAFT_50953 [Blyttiomyces helicus]|uniref:Uncharacterized protein n=1 Tax=Blyttiomyces helicus TaxID=388810 RepID=A0A4P9WE24_9FUNG|nr:hypothetical protein BDK51DRAFT_50953 [Blyttiomyces helicus]|eukprot:RKO89220.1 hypothetical protein BDK51DRAFT_50953 [Blyttiomyces helicus]